MLTLKVLSLLLSYPEQETLDALDELAAVVTKEQLLSATQQAAVLDLIDSYRHVDLLTLQENYVALFDRGRYLSLHIFEHVHGESRDRGQAMVNLLQMYEAFGFVITAHELPDYIPLFLEFLSQQSITEACELLQDALPVLSLLGARLAERNSPLHIIFDVLVSFAGAAETLEAMRQQVASEPPDDTLVHMDEIWEEEAVSFMAADNTCKSSDTTVSPMTIMSRHDYIQSQNRSL